jgi:hypothetical protein
LKLQKLASRPALLEAQLQRVEEDFETAPKWRNPHLVDASYSLKLGVSDFSVGDRQQAE